MRAEGTGKGCIEAYIAHARCRRTKDLTLLSAGAFVAELKGRSLSARSINGRIRALKQFGRWLAATRRVQFDPFASLRPMNEAEDRRHERRALTPEEANCLRRAAAKLLPCALGRTHPGTLTQSAGRPCSTRLWPLRSARPAADLFMPLVRAAIPLREPLRTASSMEAPWAPDAPRVGARDV